ncbi:MAG TPA: TIGR03000 domain-containing protein [Gemmata sp.]|nr:TIGR03000 domain-containing protein [Gemmata sp.]
MRMMSLVLATLFGLIGVANAQDGKPATVKVLLPDEKYKETILTIEGKPTKSKGTERTFTTPPLDPTKTYTYKLEALIEPNNYTKITRTIEVDFKAGETVTVDMRVKNDKTDKIVVRWVPTPDDIVDKMSEMAKISKEAVVYDPGCGDAVMLIRPIKKFGAKKGIGIDIDPKMVKIAKEKVVAEGVADKVVIREGDILNEKDMADLSEATVVLLYIGDDLGARMLPLLQKVLKPGTRIVSHRFSLGDWKPDKTEVITGADGDEYTLHYWVVKEKKKDK